MLKQHDTKGLILFSGDVHVVRVSKILLTVGALLFAAVRGANVEAAPNYGSTDTLTIDANYNLATLNVKSTPAGTPYTLLSSTVDNRIGSTVVLSNALQRPERFIVPNSLGSILAATPAGSQAAVFPQTQAEGLIGDGSLLTGYQDTDSPTTHRIVFNSLVPVTSLPEVVLLFRPDSGQGSITFTALDASGTAIPGQSLNYNLGNSGGDAYSLTTPAGGNAHNFFTMSGTNATFGYSVVSGAGAQALVRAITLNFDAGTSISGIQISNNGTGNGNFMLFEAMGVGPALSIPEPGAWSLTGIVFATAIGFSQRKRSRNT
jgi:hypothetical protein